MTDFRLRRDLALIADMIEPGARVLDLGCGDGAFLRELADRKKVRPVGIELAPKCIASCIARGVPVIQGNLDGRLDFAADGSFDWVILSRTLQEARHPDWLLSEIVRVGKRAAVSFINFAYLPNRLQIVFNGRMPRGNSIPHEWYDTPNIHLGTLRDFHALCKQLHISILREIPLNERSAMLANIAPNWFAFNCVCELAGSPNPKIKAVAE